MEFYKCFWKVEILTITITNLCYIVYIYALFGNRKIYIYEQRTRCNNLTEKLLGGLSAAFLEFQVRFTILDTCTIHWKGNVIGER